MLYFVYEGCDEDGEVDGHEQTHYAVENDALG
jgi:hypothetical protein